MEPKIVTFKRTPQADLRMHIFEPAPTGRTAADQHEARTPPCAIVFYVCGGWNGFDAELRYPQARYFASRGAVALVAEVRVINLHGTRPAECVTDGKCAIRWTRAHAGEWGVDADRIVAAGGSAAGHVALGTAMLDGFEEPGEDESTSSAPNLVCAYNPAVLPYIDAAGPLSDGEQLRIDRFGSADRVWELSPTRAVRPGLPPVIIMHGDAGEGHGFFNYRPEGNPRFEETLRDVDQFLCEHGFLEGEPGVTWPTFEG